MCYRPFLTIHGGAPLVPDLAESPSKQAAMSLWHSPSVFELSPMFSHNQMFQARGWDPPLPQGALVTSGGEWQKPWSGLWCASCYWGIVSRALLMEGTRKDFLKIIHSYCYLLFCSNARKFFLSCPIPYLYLPFAFYIFSRILKTSWISFTPGIIN